MGRHFKVKMDHEKMDSLKYFFITRIIFRRTEKMGHKYVGLWLWNHLKKGEENVVADALSRKDVDVCICVV